MEEFERVANWLNDRDLEWWPFLFMRPSQEKRMGSLRVLALAALYGVPAGLLADVWAAVSSHGAHVHLLLFPIALTLAFFGLFRATLAHAWNRRADRLRVRPRA